MRRQQLVAAALLLGLSLHGTCAMACLMSCRTQTYPARPPQLPRRKPLLLKRKSLGRRSGRLGASQPVSKLPQELARARASSKAGVHLIRTLLLCQCRCLRGDLQAAAEDAGQHPVTPDRATVALPAPSGHAAAEQMPRWLSALSVSQPRQPSQHAILADSMPNSQPEGSLLSLRHEPSQAMPHSTSAEEEAHSDAQQISHVSVPTGNKSQGYVWMLARRSRPWNCPKPSLPSGDDLVIELGSANMLAGCTCNDGSHLVCVSLLVR